LITKYNMLRLVGHAKSIGYEFVQQMKMILVSAALVCSLYSASLDTDLKWSGIF